MRGANEPASRWLELVFCIAIALLLSHELDAVAQAEWRLLPGLSTVGDKLGYDLFVLLHVPIIAIIFWLVMNPLPSARFKVQMVLDSIMIAHGIAHWLLADMPLNSFHSPLSHLLIFGASAVATAHLVLLWRSR